MIATPRLLAAPTRRESLVQHRAAHADEPEWRRVWLFHAHVYFDHAVPEHVELALGFRDRILRTFTATPHVGVHGFLPQPAGPHPRGSFEVLFTRKVYTEVLLWLTFARPAVLDILVHPLTGLQVLDHTHRAVWLGTPRALDRAMLEAADARLLVLGRTEASIFEETKMRSDRLYFEGRHVVRGPRRDGDCGAAVFPRRGAKRRAVSRTGQRKYRKPARI